jgi:hypothetical protein
VPLRAAAADAAEAQSDPLAAIVQELRKRLLGAAPGAGSAAAIASTLDLEKLGAFEKGTLFGAERDPATEAARMAIALRLIAPKARKLTQPLAALGLDLARLKSERVPELSEKLGRAMSALTSPRDYENARRVAELRGSLIAAWGEERAVLAVGQRQPTLRLAATLRSATRRVRGRVRRRERAAPARKRRGRRFRLALLAGVATLALALGSAILPLALAAALALELGAALVR